MFHSKQGISLLFLEEKQNLNHLHVPFSLPDALLADDNEAVTKVHSSSDLSFMIIGIKLHLYNHDYCIANQELLVRL